MFSGQDVLDVGSTKIGQKYVLGAVVPLDNPNWKGPWDCAEFTSWCAYQAYGLIFGAGNAKTPAKAEPYSGHWFADAKKFGHVITVNDALNIPGAALIRAPAKSKIGHVAFSMGDGDRTLEARGAAFGVDVFTGAAGRAWSIGCLLPGVDYTGVSVISSGPMPKPALPAKDFSMVEPGSPGEVSNWSSIWPSAKGLLGQCARGRLADGGEDNLARLNSVELLVSLCFSQEAKNGINHE